ncbi:MAG: prolyl oligopeptidase family serine peptidase [Alkalimonas sp.]|nr:prolyl oligopeptidase family serine peptidase [Alkalimonas sp.]
MNKVSEQITLCIAVILFVAGCSSTEMNRPAADTEPQLLRLNYQSSIDDTRRQYFVYLPAGYQQNSAKKWPVMLFLHGNGERGNGLDELDYTLIHGPLYEAWVQKRDLPFIKTDASRVYLTGISYGGFGSWYMASKHPHLFAAVVPVVGWGHPDLMPPLARAQTPLWVFAAGRDSASEFNT